MIVDLRSEGTAGGKLVYPAHTSLKQVQSDRVVPALSSSGEVEISFPEVQGYNLLVQIS